MTIDKLTMEQESKVAEYLEEGFRLGLGTDQISHQEATHLVAEVYNKVLGIEKTPTTIVVNSPLAGMMLANVFGNRDQLNDQLWDQLRGQLSDQLWDQLRSQLRGQLWDQLSDQLRDPLSDQLWGQLRSQLSDQLRGQLRGQLRDPLSDQLWGQLWGQLRGQLRDPLWDQLWGQLRGQLSKWNSNYILGCQDLYWIQFYRYINRELPVKTFDTQKLDAYFNLVSKTGWIFPYEGICIITRKPVELHWNARKQLHNPNGQAIRYADGYSLWALNGVRMTGVEYLMQPSANPADILAVKNVEQRGELIKLIGVSKFFNSISKSRLDSTGTYELYSIDLWGDGQTPRIYLKMQNPSIEEVHLEAVHPGCRTVEQALNWRNFGTYNITKGQFVAPLQLT